MEGRPWLTFVLGISIFGTVHGANVKKKIGNIDFVCPEGWVFWETNCYLMVNKMMEWSDSVDVCESYMSMGLKVKDEVENMKVAELAMASSWEQYWVGHKVEDKCQGYWDNNQPPADVGEDNCAAVDKNGRWKVVSCQSRLPFFCMKPACIEGTFDCGNGNCLSNNWLCDGVNDCGNNLDEMECPSRCSFRHTDPTQPINYFSTYASDSDCTWTIIGDPGTQVVATFSTIRLEEDVDFLEVLVGGQSMSTAKVTARLTGSLDNKVVYSTNHIMILRLMSDSSINSFGFQLTWSTTNPELSPEVRMITAGPTFTTLKSPFFPNTPPSGFRREWLVSSSDDTIVSVQIDPPDLSPEWSLVIYDGEGYDDVMLMADKASDLVSPAVYISTSNKIRIILKSKDTSGGGQGVTLQVKNGCNVNIRTDKGVVESPGFAKNKYPTSVTCSWLLQAPTHANRDIRIMFKNLVLENDNSDYIQIFNGMDDTAPSLHSTNYTGDMTSSLPTLQGGKALFVKFFSSLIQNTGKFKFEFSVDCPEIPKSANMMRSSNDTYFGIGVQFTCDEGYSFTQQEYYLKSSVIFNCQPGGKWDKIRYPTCQIIYCGAPGAIDFGFVFNSTGSVMYNSRAVYKCYQGFTMQNSAEITCLDTGKWSTPPKCISSNCGTAPTVLHATSKTITDTDGTSYGTIVEYTCNEGYEIIGTSRRLCQTDFSWSDEAPTCRKVKCPLPMIKQGQLSATSALSYQEGMTLTCNTGYIATTNNNSLVALTCLSSRKFAEVQCVDENECERPISPCSPTQTCKNKIGTFECECKPGYRKNSAGQCLDIDECTEGIHGCDGTCENTPQGSKSCSCPPGFQLFENGTNGFYVLTGETGLRKGDVYHIKHTCVPNICSRPTGFENGVIHSKKERFMYRDKLMYSCKLGFVLEGKSEVACLANGQWSDSVPVCKVAKCSAQGKEGSAAQQNAVNKIYPTTEVAFGENVYIECKKADESMFNKTRICAFNRETKTYILQGDDPKCPVVDCGPVTGIVGLNAPSLSSTVFGTSFTFTCQPGATRSGASSQNNFDVKCMENGRWGYGNLTCTAAKCPDPGTMAGTRQMYESYEQGKMINYECTQPGYTLDSNANLTCVYSGGKAEWSGTAPTCSDKTSPVIAGCSETQMVLIDKMGRPNFAVPTATDNSGFISAVTVSPQGFNPADPVWKSTDVTYTAMDGNGNSAQCQYKISLKDYSPGSLVCPEVIEYEATNTPTTYNITDKLTYSGGQLTTFPQLTVSLANVGTTTDYRVTLRTDLGTETTCAFKVQIVSGGCYDSLLPSVNNANRAIDNTDGNLKVTITCLTGHSFSNGQTAREYRCTGKNEWSPPLPLESCIQYTAPDFTFKVSLKLNTPSELFTNANCRTSFSTFYNDALSQSGSAINNFCQRGSDSAFYRFSVNDAKILDPIAFTAHDVSLTMKVENSDGAISALETCKNNINSNKETLFAMNSNGCQFIVNVGSSVGIYESGESCPSGFTLTAVGTGKQCLPCSPGYFKKSDGSCEICPDGEYQDFAGQTSCKSCGPNTASLTPRITAARCIDKCMNGFFSSTGSPPCKPCPVDTYWQSHDKCEICPDGGSTLNVQGATSSSQCRAACPAGQYSKTGYAPCSPCPQHFYQDQTTQTQCIECAQGSFTQQTGSKAFTDCKIGSVTEAECSPICNSTGGTCEYLYHRLVCSCKPGYTGSKCDTMINYCASSPCFNDGQCQPKLNGYECTCPTEQQCTMQLSPNKYQDIVSFIASFSGVNEETCKAQCVSKSDCVAAFLYSSGFCTLHNAEQVAGRVQDSTKTSAYYEKDCQVTNLYSGTNCEKDDDDDCVGNNCNDVSVCRDGINTFQCVCPSGGTYSQPRCDPNANLCNPNPCLNNGLCNSFDGVRYQCTCLAGYTGVNCETQIDECALNPEGCLYGGQCVKSVNSYSCNCQPGFSGSNCQDVRDFCSGGACNNGICLNNYVNLTSECICENPFEKDTTSGLCSRMNFCTPNPCNSTNTQRCDSLSDGYRCVCQPGFEGTLCQHNTDDCASKPCVHGTCMDGVNTYSCNCDPGWTGATCNLDEKDCLGQCPDARSSQCVDLNQDYECVCRPGYTGKNCTEDIDECQSLPCQHDGNCTDGNADYTCSCAAGWTGKNCETMVDECARQGVTCQNDGVCYTHYTSAFCSCKKGTQGDRCEDSPAMCSLLPPCTGQGTCQQIGGSAMCNCIDGYSGVSCELIKDYCASSADTCKNRGTCSPRDPNGYSCNCPTGYSGETCDIKADPCTTGSCPSQTLCISEGETKYCICSPKKIASGDTCKDASSDFDLFLDPTLGPVKVRSVTPFRLSGDMTIMFWIGYFSGDRSIYISNRADSETYIELFSDKINFKVGDEVDEVKMERGSLETVKGQWDHVAITWSKSGAYQLYINALKIASGTTEFNLTMSDSLKMVRFDSNFTGYISQLTVWREVLGLLDIAQSVQNVNYRPLGDLALGWRQYYMTGGVRRFVPTGAGQAETLCQDGRPKYSSCEGLPDKMKPMLTSCPTDDVTKDISDRTIETMNVFTKPGSSGTVMSTLTDDLMMKGRYDVVYASKDDTGNYGICRFKVYIKGPSSCSKNGFPVIPTPCGSDAITDFCSPGQAPSVLTPNILRCGKLGSFNLQKPIEPFVPPVCGAKTSQKFSVKITLIYVLPVTCTNFLLESIKPEINAKFVNDISKKWPNLCEGACENMEIVPKCNLKEVIVDVTFINLDEKIANKENTVSLRSDEILRITAIETTDLQLADFGTLQTDRKLVVVVLLPSCSSLQAVSGGNCVSCGPGSYFNATMESCELCPVGSYTDVSRQSSCTSCGVKTTLMSGSRSSTDCVAGEYYTDGSCKPCPRDFYQDMEGKSFCHPCQLNKRTKDPGTVSRAQCFDDCASGTELQEDGSCKDCPQGFYRTQTIHDKCQACSGGNTTEGPRTTSASGCNLPGCLKGNYINEHRECLQCPHGKFQPEKWQRSCISCRANYTTVLEGADNETLCKFVCPSGMEETPVGSMNCSLCPRSTYRDDSLAQRFLPCQNCETGFTTAGTGSTNKTTDCTIRVCRAGNYRNVTDNKCYPCPIGQYQPHDLQTSCISCKDSYTTETEGAINETASCKFFCPDGQEILSAASATCRDCPRGTHRSNTASLRFQPCQTCTGDKTTESTKSKLPEDCNIKICSAGQKLTSNKLGCDDCPVDTYQPDDLPSSSTQCKPCGVNLGTKQPKSTNISQCLPFCLAGQQVKSGECELCPKGTWNDGSPQKRFLPCERCSDTNYTTPNVGAKNSSECTIRDCPAGYKINEANCDPCGYGMYQPDRASTGCLECGTDRNTSTTTADSADMCTVSCPPGKQGVDGSCSPCPPDRFKDAIGYSICQPCTGDKTSDENRISCDLTYCDAGVGFSSGTCVTCIKGFYKEGRGNQPCLECPKNFTTASTKTASSTECNVLNCEPGLYAHMTSSCTPCPKGYYKNLVGPQNCTMCSPDKTTPGEGSTTSDDCSLVVCPAGEYRTTGNSCSKCPLGEYQSNAGATSCTKCTGSYTTAAVGSTQSTDCLIVCEPGKFRSGRDACSDCEVGQYQPNSGATSCINCTAGYTTKARASNSETLCYRQCPEGQFRPSTDRTACNDCPAGQYQSQTGQTECQSCDPNFTTLQTRSTSPNQCMPECSSGKYLNVTQRACIACPLGTYQPISATTVQECTKCQPGKTTANTGSSVIGSCTLDDCEPGFYRKEGQGCQACGQGQYQPLKGQTSCMKCKAGFTTSLTVTTATKETQCIRDCPNGQEYDVITNQCILCEIGKIRDKTVLDYCYNCPTGQSTSQKGALSCIMAPTPSAGALSRRRVAVRMTFIVAVCDNRNVIEHTLRISIFSLVRRQSNNYPRLCIGNCDNILIAFIIPCGRAGTGRRRRAAESVTAEITATDLPESIENAGKTLSRDGESLLKEALANTDPVNNDLAAAGITSPTVTSTNSTVVCLSGSVIKSGACEACAAGSYHNTSSDQCVSCEMNTYQDKTGQTSCTSCPTARTTRGTGSTAASDCLVKCAVDSNYCKNGGVCINGGCQCTDYYSGEDCSERQTVESNLQWIIIGVCIGIGVLLLAVLIIGYFCCRKAPQEKKSRDMHSLYSPSTGVPDYMQSPFVRGDYIASQGYVQYPNPEYNDAYDFYKSGR